MRITKATLRQEAALLPASPDNYLCQQCQQFSKCATPFQHEIVLQPHKAAVHDRILFVTSQPLVNSPLGMYFKKHVLKTMGLHPEQCAFVSAIACSSTKVTIAPQVEHCRAFVMRAIGHLCPVKIVLLGTDAARSVLEIKNPVLKELTGIVHRVHVCIDTKWENYPAIVTYSLAHSLRDARVIDVIRGHIRQFVYEEMTTKEWPIMVVL